MEPYRQRLYQHYWAAGAKGQGHEEVDRLDLRAAHLQNLIRQHFPPDKDAAILDVGCGHGAMLYFARQAGYHNTAGIDCSAAQVAEAGRRGITGIIEGNVLQVLDTFPAESQDVVIAFDVIEHFTKDELLGCLDQVYRVLKTGGKLIIHAPNGASPFFGRIRYGDFTHELAVTRESMTQLCQVCGFSQISCYEDQPVPHGLKSGIRWLLWKVIRGLLRSYIAVETGALDSGMIFSQNLFCVATK
jgi:cyclopropane fatty-acyl-phospholipid synthase-like methyltransferase